MKVPISIIFGLLPLLAAADNQLPLTLERALLLAKQNRPAISAATKRLEEARALMSALGSYPATRLDLGYTSEPDVGGSDEDLLLSQPLDLFGRASAGRSLGFAGFNRAEAEMRAVMLDVQFETITAFFDAAFAAEMDRLGKEQLDIAIRLRDAAKLRFEAGKTPEVQLLRAQLEADRFAQIAERRKAESRAAIARLDGALGTPDAAYEIAIQRVEVVSIDPSGVESRIPALMVLAADIRAAEAEARLHRLSLSPDIGIEARRNPWYVGEPEYGARLRLSIPLLDHGKAHSEEKAALARAEFARLVLKDQLLLASSELASAKALIDAAQRNVETYGPILSAARDLLRRSEIGFREGALTLVEVLESLRALRDVEEAAAEARRDLGSAYAAYLRAGGLILEVSP